MPNRLICHEGANCGGAWRLGLCLHGSSCPQAVLVGFCVPKLSLCKQQVEYCRCGLLKCPWDNGRNCVPFVTLGLIFWKVHTKCDMMCHFQHYSSLHSSKSCPVSRNKTCRRITAIKRNLMFMLEVRDTLIEFC